MKNLLVASLLLIAFQSAQAQFFSFGLKGGLNTQVNKPSDIFVGTGDTSFQFGVNQKEFGTQFGAYFRFGNRIFIQPEFIFNSNKADYKIGESSFVDVIKNERYNFMDMPILVGFKLGPIRFQGGPVGHYFINSASELTDIQGYKAKFKEMTWGYQTGLNIAFGRFSIDARYEGNFTKQGDHITFFGDKYNFSNTPSRLILGVNIALIK
ncbi:MAG: outer membrane beta-barrel protein [Saprospiraceae bacterium]|nr:outer membrane beta-barrel protein [Saprospiraceae bacterium]MCB9343690.1 outer membrane beta-barrel protein [Lewinellaceae bacterium]